MRILSATGSSAITYRKQPWWLILAGGLGGYIFGTAWTWKFPLGWQSHMTDGVSDVQTWLAFLKSINWWTLQPDFGRALDTTGSTGWNTASLVGTGWAYNWDAYISQAADSLTGGAHLSVAYFSQGSAQSLTVRMNRFAGPVTAKWVEPDQRIVLAHQRQPVHEQRDALLLAERQQQCRQPGLGAAALPLKRDTRRVLRCASPCRAVVE